MSPIPDQAQRIEATDPNRSYIVQAPAGSGKTEILTQRYLRLLSRVRNPEHIIALTFTRKAASEMRERIVLALQTTAASPPPLSDHKQQTYQLAKQALAQSQALHWNILQHPSRLRIITLDSLCQSITQAIPLIEKHIPFATITEKPQSYFLQAANHCLRYALHHPAYQEPLTLLLLHLDNRQDKVLSLFKELLAHREQWLSLVLQGRSLEKQHFEEALAWIEQHALQRLEQSLPLGLFDALKDLLRNLAQVTSDTTPAHALFLTEHQVPPSLNRQQATAYASLLLTSQHTLRKAFDHHIGLKKGMCSASVYQQLKQDSKALLEEITTFPDFVEALIAVKYLPEPYYQPQQWHVLQALLALLPLLAGHLHLVFSEARTVDFTAVSQQAAAALGDEDNPTDLALYLDHSIQHILVDEFQDTSLQQFHLLCQLVQSWQPGDGKTLFVVGDPMQSIYRFRQAEVGLFLRAKQQGIGPVTLTPLTLECNFRSTATVVDWINTRFRCIFPNQEDIESGAVSFSPSQSHHPAAIDSHVKAFQYDDKSQEAKALLDTIQDELQRHPGDNIAILVRSRNQLTEITRLLRSHAVPFQGVDIDLLAQLAHLRDVWTLTQALLHPGNRLVWLALLRSPYGGLSLVDLHAIVNFQKQNSIYRALLAVDEIPDISEAGHLRAQFVGSVFENAFARRYQTRLVEWIEETHLALHGSSILSVAQQHDLEQFWRLVDRFERDGQLPDLLAFQSEFSQLYSQRVTPSRLQVMTIHKSKGLEFDCVILPGLSAKPAKMSTPLLRWLTLPTTQQDLLLLSPIKAMQEETCLLYDYLGRIEAEKASYELQRLLYVAATRAKKRLYLSDHRHTETGTRGTFRHLLANQSFVHPENAVVSPTESSLPALFHLPLTYYLTRPPPHDAASGVSTFLPSDTLARVLGLVTHGLLQWVCDNHPSTLEDIPWGLARHHLTALGLIGVVHDGAMQTIKDRITAFFLDPVGQWIMQPHREERNEYALLSSQNHTVKSYVIDRTFCEQDTRWVIDFKTGRDDNLAMTEHRNQVNHYAHLLRVSQDNAIRCGLYYLATNRWVHWEYDYSTVIGGNLSA